MSFLWGALQQVNISVYEWASRLRTQLSRLLPGDRLAGELSVPFDMEAVRMRVVLERVETFLAERARERIV